MTDEEKEIKLKLVDRIEATAWSCWKKTQNTKHLDMVDFCIDLRRDLLGITFEECSQYVVPGSTY